MAGEHRKEIMDICPESFKDELGSWIDKIESDVVDLKDLLDIECVADTGKIEEAYDFSFKLASALY